jgi:flagellar biosynthesis protein FlhA
MATAATTMQGFWSEKILRSDVMLALGLVLILLVMVIPLPPMLIDILLSMSITLALMIMIISLYTKRALDFAVFPSVLLAATLFRLSLNVASTRLILLRGNEGPEAAGSVIQSFGQFVVGGNYVVGLVVFSILVIINFLVITKGAGRVAEVAARFTLDAMPGKQMAIDADLNAGLIDDNEARERRKEIAREANFHGSMDGASKFVKGDAIAGIIITLVNIGAGFIIGVLQKGMPMGEAAANYTILTVGDGLVGQIPALIISTSAGILVTRSGESQDFGTELKNQFTFSPRAIWVVSGVLFLFAIIPGLPFLPFITLAILLAVGAYKLERKSRQPVEEEIPAPSKERAIETEEDYERMLSIDLLELEVGYGLIPFVDAAQDGELLSRIRSIRKQFALEKGFIVPPIHIKDNLQLKPNEYSICLKGVRVASGEMLPGYHMAMNPGTATETIKGIATQEPAFGLPAIWIPEDKKEQAQIAGYTVVDCVTVMATHISEMIKRHAHELLGRQEAQNLLDNLAKSYPKLVEELIPNLLNLGTVMNVLQNLLREDITIRDLRTILETMADLAPTTKDVDTLTEHVRHALARQISTNYAAGKKTLGLLTFDRVVEETIQKSLQHGEGGTYLAIDPTMGQAIIDGLGKSINALDSNTPPVLLCTPTIRPHVKRLTERYFPNLGVISHNEIAPNLNVKSIGTVRLHAS